MEESGAGADPHPEPDDLWGDPGDSKKVGGWVFAVLTDRQQCHSMSSGS